MTGELLEVKRDAYNRPSFAIDVSALRTLAGCSDDGEQSGDTTVSDAVVGQIKDACARRTLERALAVGELVIQHLYQGDLCLWRQKKAKWQPFRALVKHGELPLSAAELYRCTAVYELATTWDAEQRWQRLGVSHLRLVVGLDTADQVALLDRANERQWSVTRLNREVRRARSHAPEQRGRPRVHPAIKVVKRMSQAVSASLTTERSHVQVEELDVSELREMHELLLAVHSFCGDMRARVERSIAQRATTGVHVVQEHMPR